MTIIGNVGTPTAVAALPIALKLGVPFFAPYTGAGILRHDPPDHFVINIRASYAEETASMVDALLGLGGLQPEEIAFFTQRDAYGDSGYTGGLAALKRHGLLNETSVAHARYERNTLAVEEGLAAILGASTPPRAVIMVGTYAPCAKFIRQARDFGMDDVVFLNVSFVGATSLAAALGDAGDNVIITQVVPHFDSELPIARDYRAAIASLKPALEPSFSGLEGYIAVRVLRLALERIEGPVGREALVTALESLGTFDIGVGQPLHLDAAQHQASHHVWPTVVKGGRVLPFDWERLPELTASPE